MKETSSNIKLRERVKELRCLYEIFQIAWEAPNDIPNILSKTLAILANAMQYPEQARVSISTGKEYYTTHDFTKNMRTLSCPIGVDKKKYGTLRIGYRS